MRAYTIKRATRQGEDYETMTIRNRDTGDEVAEYRLTPGCEGAEITSLRRAIDRHIDNGGGLGNYQW